MALSNANKAIIAKLARSDVEKCLAGALRFLKSGRWLGNNNRYARDIVATLKRDAKAGRAPNPRHLSQYVSVSSLLHCTDGWSYLGRSFIALMQGDANSALHLAYYAELRAAMSLLACQGVGVLDHIHCVIDRPEGARVLAGVPGTHVFVWDCLAFWSGQAASGETFASVVRPQGRTLEDWLSPIGGARAVAPQARRWCQQWGMDLMRLARDQSARNSASYRPSGIAGSNSVPANEAVDLVRDLWLVLEPMASSGFESLDWQILRLSLERYFKGRFDKEPSDDPGRFKALIQSIMDRQNLTPAVAAARVRFLLRVDDPDDAVVFTFSRVSPTSMGVGKYFGVISRAVLLLRIASGSTAMLFESAGVRKSHLGFWRQEIGTGRGLWGKSGEPAMLADLWTDVATALKDIGEFDAAIAEDKTYHHLGSTFGQSFAPLASCERAVLWSVAAN